MRSAVTLAVNGKRPIIASIATDLPEPDSPTIASTSLGATVRSTPSTALKAPVRVAKAPERLRISRSGMSSAAAVFWVERGAQAIAAEIDRHDGDEGR